MSNDSKLGLLAGVAAVILIAVVYFQNGAGGPAKQAEAKPAASAIMPSAAVASTPAEAVRR